MLSKKIICPTLMILLIACGCNRSNNEFYNGLEISDYLIITVNDVFDSRDLFIQSFNADGDIEDKITLNAPSAWRTEYHDGYINIYGSKMFYLVDTSDGEIFLVSANGFVEDSYIVDNYMVFMTNDGVDGNSYNSNVCYLNIGDAKQYTQDDYVCQKVGSIPYDLFIDEDRVYFLYDRFQKNTKANESSITIYDRELNEIDTIELDQQYSYFLGKSNDEIVVASINDYLLYPSMIKVETPTQFERFSSVKKLGDRFIRTNYSHDGSYIYLEKIDENHMVQYSLLPLKTTKERVNNVSGGYTVSLTYHSEQSTIKFYDVYENEYDVFEYKVEKGIKEIGSYSLKSENHE